MKDLEEMIFSRLIAYDHIRQKYAGVFCSCVLEKGFHMTGTRVCSYPFIAVLRSHLL